MFKKLKSLKTKIFLSYLLVTFILIIVTFWSINTFNSLSEAINNIMVENYRSIEASESMIASLERQDSGLLMMIDERTVDGRQTFHSNEQEFLKWLARAEDNITIEGEAKIISNISSSYLEYKSLFEEFQLLEQQTKREFYYQEIFHIFNQIKEEIRELRSINQETMVNAQQTADNRATTAIYSNLIISGIAILIAIIFGYYLSNLILKPINKLKSAIQKISERNFEHTIKTHSHDEIGDLTEEFNKMIKRLQEYEKMNINKLVAERDKSRAIVNNINSPLLVTDEENKLTLLNHKAKELFQITEEYTDIHFLELIKNEKLFEIIKKADHQKQEKKEFTITIEKRDKTKHYKVASSTVKAKNIQQKYTITLLEDITKLKEIDEMKSDFVSTVSHEFRTPLTSINMSLSLLLEEKVGSINKEQKQLLKASAEDCDRLNNLVDDLLNLSKIESGKIKMDFQKAKINEIIKSTIKPFQKQAEEKNITIQKEKIDENLFICADANKISWVISNLLGNALRYTSKGGEITIGCQSKGNRVEVFVKDTGIGIPDEYQEKIFEKFVRANQEDDNASGTGLGLAIAKEIIEAHQGNITLESEEGKGSKFIFSIPRYCDYKEL